MSTVESIIASLMSEIDRIVDRKVEEKVSERMSAMLRPAPEVFSDSHLVDATEIASTIFGDDVSTPKAIAAARKHVYNLANLGRIPYTRPTPRRLLFDPVAVRKALNDSRQESNAA